MDILIKGMKMPKNCCACPLFFCKAFDAFDKSDYDKLPVERMKNCPLVPVPPHGDLIDRDALKAAICSRLCIKSEEYLSPEEATIVNEIFASPIIIPASEEGE